MPYDVFLILRDGERIKISTEVSKQAVGEIVSYLLDLTEVIGIDIRKNSSIS